MPGEKGVILPKFMSDGIHHLQFVMGTYGYSNCAPFIVYSFPDGRFASISAAETSCIEPKVRKAMIGTECGAGIVLQNRGQK